MLASALQEMEAVLTDARRHGAREADVARAYTHTVSVRRRMNRVAGERTLIGDEAVLRVWRNECVGTAAGAGCQMRSLVAPAVESARIAGGFHPCRPADRPTKNHLCPIPSSGPDRAQLVDLAAACEQAVAHVAARVDLEVAWDRMLYEVANSQGVGSRRCQDRLTVTCHVVHGNGHAAFRLRGTPADPPDPEELVRQCEWDVQHSAICPDRTVPENAPVLLAPLAVAQLLAAVAEALRADRMEEGRSFVRANGGDLLAGAALTLVEDPTLERQFDAEGVPTRPLTLVKNGLVVGTLHTLATFDAYGGGTRGGHAIRRALNEPVYPGSIGLSLSARHLGDNPFEVLHRGLLITHFRSISSDVPLTGRVSSQITAYRVIGGEVAGKLPEASATLHLQELLMRLTGQCGALERHSGPLSAALPYLLTESIHVSA